MQRICAEPKPNRAAFVSQPGPLHSREFPIAENLNIVTVLICLTDVCGVDVYLVCSLTVLELQKTFTFRQIRPKLENQREQDIQHDRFRKTRLHRVPLVREHAYCRLLIACAQTWRSLVIASQDAKATSYGASIIRDTSAASTSRALQRARST